MTEEIIIDCGWYRNGWCGCETEDMKCEQIKLCRFKDDKLKQQLKHLEQENKELKEEKLAIKRYLGIESKAILERLEELDEWKHNDKLLLWKYRSALDEIKKMVSGHYPGRPRDVLGIINEVLQ